MDNNTISLEEKLFSAIQSQSSKSSCWKKETMQILGLGKSAFYNRLSGQTPLHLKDALLLAKHFKIPINILFDHPKEESQLNSFRKTTIVIYQQ
ncbi:MAG: helix-turn-helix domain-containing protein [Saprospiraceae bacterium]